ncbi:toll/interleukin-1 receptor domain-containing protein [Marivita hallyeonensis]|uniref:TIR domain-containing protein n=1 Tax=Marivita hallyeonensis TaxID=996342 RepID=A0A1M5Y942_9RHOB|nr:toll/interleukin-1 receptor domain-containing protein [Marivita hallyeonensis]SHI08354.1 TIR domain-containing protein [Marivita hallyeonensis]
MAAQPNKREVFLCHSSKDKHYVRKLALHLEAMGVGPWFDAWELSVGDSLIERIGQGINSASFFCIILSAASAESNWCKNELSEALANSIESGRNNILVVRKGKVPIPPFLKHRLFIDAPRYSLKVPLSISFRAFGFSPKDIDLLVSLNRVSDIESALEILSLAAKKNAVEFGKDDWALLRALLARRGVLVDGDDLLRISSLKHGENFLAC